MTSGSRPRAPRFGSSDLRLPDALRGPLRTHLEDLRAKYLARGWGNRVGFGARPALVVIDMARNWLDPSLHIGSNLDSVLDATRGVLAAARAAGIPIFFTSYAHDPAAPPSPRPQKLTMQIPDGVGDLFDLDPSLAPREDEKLLRKRHASAFKGTEFHEMLSALGIDTLIVTGVSTSHCVYATCRDASEAYRVIVPHEAVGERCELMHEVDLLDIDLDLGDVIPAQEVIEHLERLTSPADTEPAETSDSI